MKIFTIIAGVNGVGKSSLTGVLRSEYSNLGTVIDVDSITASLNGNKIAGGKTAIKRIEDCLLAGVNFTQETTLSGLRTRKMVKRAKEDGYVIRLYYVGLDSEQESILRIDNRVRKGGHDIPKEDVIRRFENRIRDLQMVLQYCDEAVFFDNNNGFVEVAEYKNGRFMTKGNELPLWVKEFELGLAK